MRNVFPGYSYANLEDFDTGNLARNDPYEFFLRYPEPVIIDEVQEVPSLLSQVQVRCDERNEKGQYILTGSQQLALKANVQSLAGRTAILYLYPLSLEELSHAGISIDRDKQMLAGFYPALYQTTPLEPSEYYGSYVSTYLERDIRKQNISSLSLFQNFMRLLAGRVGQLVNYSDIADILGVSSVTIKSWLSILEHSHVVFFLNPWFPSRDKQIVKTRKIYFCDTGLACSLLGIHTPDLVHGDRVFGGLFENMVIMEAVKCLSNQNLEPRLFFFRNTSRIEVDLIREDSMELVPYEIKASQTIRQDFGLNMDAFQALYPDKVSSHHTVIYSGSGNVSFKGTQYVNYNETSTLFTEKEPAFIFDPWKKE